MSTPASPLGSMTTQALTEAATKSPADKAAVAGGMLDSIAQMIQGLQQAGGNDASNPLLVSGKLALPAPVSFSTAGAPGQPVTSAPPPAFVPYQQTPYLPEYGTKKGALNAGLTSIGNTLTSFVNTVEQKQQQKKAAEAEGYLMQINGLLASGDPRDRQQAELFLENPKVLNTLKKGLNYVPLTDQPPPEAKGVASGFQRIIQKLRGQRQANQGGQQSSAPVLPHPSTQDQLRQAMQNAMLQRLKQDPNYAISLMGGSQLTSQQQARAQQFAAGLGFSPTQIGTMNFQDQMAMMSTVGKVYSDALTAQSRLDVARITAQSRTGAAAITGQAGIDREKIMAQSRKQVVDAMIAYNTAHPKGSAMSNMYGATAKIYADLADSMTKASQNPGVSPTDQANYQALAAQYRAKADKALLQSSTNDMMYQFMQTFGVSVAAGGAPPQ